jgi:hypothetical protein
MHKALIGLGWLTALAMAGTATAQAGQGQAGPQPNHQKEKQGTGLFPPNQPAPVYSTGRNNAVASLQAHGSTEPNAGATGLTGSGSTTTGWSAPAYSGSERR